MKNLQVHAQGLVIRDLPLIASNFRNTEDLSSYLKRHNIVAIADIDTRKLTRLLREKAHRTAASSWVITPDAQLALEKSQSVPRPERHGLAKEVTTRNLQLDARQLDAGGRPAGSEGGKRAAVPRCGHDFGAKRNILRMLVDCGRRLTVVPAKTSAEEVLKMNPDGIFPSNGPATRRRAITPLPRLRNSSRPIFRYSASASAITLALASGAKTVKMKFGHHGGNHPVKDIDNNVVMITAQNHGFAVDEASMPANLRVTHKSLFDGTLQGIHRTDKPAFSFQGHLEASPGPHDAAPVVRPFYCIN